MIIVRGAVVFLDIVLAVMMAYFAKLSINDRETKTGFAAMMIFTDCRRIVDFAIGD